ncbi:MAG: hypothetical protein UV04_C0032G0015 [Candidatus Gottesmanbacteria bacterium GW2011_GWA2_42_16]|nr:MAG: hypothetical protein UV04_C0032G0015 [Candidatus Gottesmanbacteria bacterium GW2011_GWA2_42_16]HCM82634.1 hypothetical protein [Patescibacteria group bacterium]
MCIKEIKTPGIIEVKQAITSEEIEYAKKLIEKTLYTPMGFTFSSIEDGKEEVRYVIALEENVVIGAGRLRLKPEIASLMNKGLQQRMREFYGEGYENGVAQFYGLAVEDEFRNLGIGKKLYRLREKLALKEGKIIGIALARSTSMSLYESEGYFIIGLETVEINGNRPLVRSWVTKLLTKSE